MVADGHYLPFVNGSIAEVYMSNVVGSQMTDSSVQKLLGESHRVLRGGGRLTLRENITPAWVSKDLGRYVVEADFNRGLTRYDHDSPEHAQLVELYGLAPHDEGPGYKDDHFFAVAVKE